MDTPVIQAALFDMDGTLIDSEPYWLDAETRLVESYGGSWSQEQGLALVGSGLWDSAQALRSAGVDLELREIIDWLSTSVRERLADTMPWRPGARELLRVLRDHSVPTALVTMSFRENAEFIAQAMGAELAQTAFDVIVAGDDVTQPKPNPEPYLTAAHRLGVDIHQCVAFEDSVFGAASALSAGAMTIGIPLHVDIPESYASILWDTLEGKGLGEINREFSSWKAKR